MKLFLVILLLTFSCSIIVYSFYQEDIKNNLPTQLPPNYVSTTYGQVFNIKANKKLKLIHFFNPDCPCSKFNTKHIQNLYTQYQGEVEFVAYATKSVPATYPIPVRLDIDGKMAELLGVYSTPQAVLLDANGKMLYRGNYNKSRYCGSKNSEYVAQAIAQALNEHNTLSLMQLSGKPYGCSIK